MQLFKQLGDNRNVAASLSNLGDIGLLLGKYDIAQNLVDEALPILRQLGDKRGLATALLISGLAKLELGQTQAARIAGEESHELFNELEFSQGMADCLSLLGRVALLQGDIKRATALLAESLRRSRSLENSDRPNLLPCLDGFARLALENNMPDRAVTLWSAVKNFQKISHLTPLDPRHLTALENHLTVLQQRLGEDRYQAAFNPGQVMSQDHAITFALD